MSCSTYKIALILCVVFLIAAPYAVAQKTDFPRLEFGPELNNIYLPIHVVGSINYQPGLGGIFSANLGRAWGLDASVTITPTPTSAETSNAGGRLLQFYGGVKAGLRKKRFGVFGTLRPGIVSFGSVVKTVDLTTGQATFQRLSMPSLDVGGIVELYVTRRFALRYEAGDSIIGYRRRRIFSTLPPFPGQTTNNFQFAIGFMLRFR